MAIHMWQVHLQEDGHLKAKHGYSAGLVGKVDWSVVSGLKV